MQLQQSSHMGVTVSYDYLQPAISFPINFACQKLALKVANGDHVILGH